MHGRVRGIEIAEERELAGKVAGVLYLTGALTVSVLLLLPGTVTTHARVALSLAGFGFAWGLACFFLIRWRSAHPLVSHLSCAMGFPITAAGMAATGGADSPAKFYLFFIVVYCGYFWRPLEAFPYFLGCLAVHALPLAYDPHAVQDGLLGELLIAGPAYVVLGGLILAGKRLLVDLREQATQLAHLDPLTGLYNRRALIERMSEHVGGARDEDRAGLVLLDLDGFKDANTLYGHPGGDRVLCATAEAMRSVARESDMVARLGGDEFALLAHGVDGDTVHALAQRMLEAVRRAADETLPELRLTASVGWVIYPDDARTVDELVASADLCMRGAKASGKNRVQAPLEWLPAPAA